MNKREKNYMWITINVIFVDKECSLLRTKKEKIDCDLCPPECEMYRILSNREHFASHRIQNGTEMINYWSRVTSPNGVASH